MSDLEVKGKKKGRGRGRFKSSESSSSSSSGVKENGSNNNGSNQQSTAVVSGSGSDKSKKSGTKKKGSSTTLLFGFTLLTTKGLKVCRGLGRIRIEDSSSDEEIVPEVKTNSNFVTDETPVQIKHELTNHLGETISDENYINQMLKLAQSQDSTTIFAKFF